jgi:hypothetical protein
MRVSRKPNDKYEARYRRDNKTIHVGTFETKELARDMLKLDRQTYDATMAQPVDRYREEHLDAQKEPTLWERIKAAFRG